jgi:hypothetical protein
MAHLCEETHQRDAKEETMSEAPLSEVELSRLVRRYVNKYSLTAAETLKFIGSSRDPETIGARIDAIEMALETWREANSLPHTQSSLTRGKLLSLIKKF